VSSHETKCTFARELRREQTSYKAIRWNMLRDRKLAALTFRRQVPIGHYFADYVCLEKRSIWCSVVDRSGFEGAFAVKNIHRAVQRTIAIILLFCAMPTSATAAERDLTGPEIALYLSGHTIIGQQGAQRWTQSFAVDGTTSFAMGRPSDPGLWKIEGDRYCSQWGANAAWSCWIVRVDGDAVTFINPDKPDDIWPGQRQPKP
jgi:hypothetical protein